MTSRDELMAAINNARNANRPRCPVHGMRDCSPLLNGCSIPLMMARAMDAHLDLCQDILDLSATWEEPAPGIGNDDEAFELRVIVGKSLAKMGAL